MIVKNCSKENYTVNFQVELDPGEFEKLLALTACLFTFVAEGVRVSEMIKARHFSVRSTEEYVKKANLKASASGARKDPPDALSIDYIADIEHRLMRTLGRKVSIAAKGKKHRITLEFSDEADFEELVSRLDPEILKY